MARAGGPDQAPQAHARDRTRRQVHRAAGRISVGHRVAQARGLGPRSGRQDPLGGLRDRHPRDRRRASGGSGRDRRPRRLRPPRHRGQGSGGPLRPPESRPVPWSVSGAAVRGDRVRPRRAPHRRCQLDRVRHVHRTPGDRLHVRPADDAGEGRDHAPGPVSGPAHSRLEGRRGLRHRARLRAASASLRGQQPVPRPARGRGNDPVGSVAGWPPGRDRGAAGSPLVRRQPVPSGVPQPARSAASALRRFHRSGRRPGGRPRAGVPGPRRRRLAGHVAPRGRRRSRSRP